MFFIYKKPICRYLCTDFGAGAPAIFWTDEFCHKIVASGFNVIRFDNRDIGLSDPVDWDKNPYTIEDLARDVLNKLNVAVLDSTPNFGAMNLYDQF